MQRDEAHAPRRDTSATERASPDRPIEIELRFRDRPREPIADAVVDAEAEQHVRAFDRFHFGRDYLGAELVCLAHECKQRAVQRDLA